MVHPLDNRRYVRVRIYRAVGVLVAIVAFTIIAILVE